MTQELIKRGHSITVLTGWPNYPKGVVFPAFRNDREKFSEYHGARIFRVPLIARGRGGVRLLLNYISFALSASFLGVWLLRHRQFDAIFAFEPSPITVGIPAAIISRLKKVPWAFWILDLWPETLQAIGVVRSPAVLRVVGWLVSAIYRHCDLILGQSRGFVPMIAKYAGPNARIEYFPNWADHFPTVHDVVPAAEVPDDPEAFNVLFAGNVGEAQDFPAILRAAELLRDRANVRWLIVGDGRLSPWLAREVEARGLSSTMLLLGRFPPERMQSFFLHAHALLVSLKDEPIFSYTIPGKVQSYLGTGLPVLTMLNGEGARIIRDAQAGIVCASGDSQALADAVVTLSTMSVAERRRMGQNGLALAQREFDRDTLVSKLEQWLEQLEYPHAAPPTRRVN